MKLVEHELARPNIFAFQDFRKYLKAYFDYRKHLDESFSLRILQKEMGINSHSHYFDIMYGRSLTSKFMPLYIAWFGFNAKEQEYFIALVDYDQSTREVEKMQAYKKMITLSPKLKSLQLGADYLRFFQDWYNPVLLTLLALYPQEDNPEFLCRLFKPNITLEQVQSALHLLVELGIIKWDSEKKEWEILNRYLQCEDRAKQMALKPYHRKMQQLGIYHYDENYQEQKFACLTLATTYKTAEKVQELIDKCRAEIMETVKKDEGQEFLLQVNMQTFPIARRR
jgi:uncharacterized protein (TIGR02147 family)